MKKFLAKIKVPQKRTPETPNIPNKHRFQLPVRFLPLLFGFAAMLPLLVCWFADHSSKIRVTPDGIRIPAWEILPEEAVDSSYPYYFYYNQPCLRYEDRFYWPYNRSFRYSDLKLEDPVIPVTCQEDSYSAYAIQGIDPAVMLYIKNGPGSLFIHNNDLTLRTGADLFEKRIPLSGHYNAAYFSRRIPFSENPVASYTSLTSYFKITEEFYPLLNRFLEALQDAPFLRIQDTPLQELSEQYKSRKRCPLYLKLDNGIVVTLYLYSDGYVCIDDFWGICLLVDTQAFSDFLSLLMDPNAYIPVLELHKEAPAFLSYSLCQKNQYLGDVLSSRPPTSLDTPEATFSCQFPSYQHDAYQDYHSAREIWIKYSAGSDPIQSPHYTLQIHFFADSEQIHWGYPGEPPLLSSETISPESITALKNSSFPEASFADAASADTSFPETSPPTSLFDSSFQNSKDRIRFSVCVHERVYTLSSYGLDAETAYEIMQDVLPLEK